MNLEQQANPGFDGHNHSDYPDLDDAPSFAWSGHQEAGSGPHPFSANGEVTRHVQLYSNEDYVDSSDDHRSMTR